MNIFPQPNLVNGKHQAMGQLILHSKYAIVVFIESI